MALAISGCASGAAASGNELTAVSAPCFAGRYQGGAMEIAAGLELSPDSRFRYFLSYGALDEWAEGRWAAYDKGVWLTSDPVTPPAFEVVREEASGDADFHIALDLPAGLSRQYFDAALVYRDGHRTVRQLEEDGLAIDAGDGAEIEYVQLLLPIFHVEGDPYRIRGAGARAVRFRFVANELGKVAFAGEAVRYEGGVMAMERHGRTVRLSRTEDLCQDP